MPTRWSGDTVRCRSCNDILTDKEATMKDVNGRYEEMCAFCLADIGLEIEKEPLFPDPYNEDGDE